MIIAKMSKENTIKASIVNILTIPTIHRYTFQ